jgi:glycosyltransferase involved in cell wall biosynthesis
LLQFFSAAPNYPDLREFMHILISAISRFNCPSGVCRYAANLARCLVESDRITKVTLVLGEWQTGYFQKSFEIDSQKTNLVPVTIKNNSLSRNIWFLLKLPGLVKKVKPDIVHLSYPIPIFNDYFSVPVVATIHDFYPFDKPENFGFPHVYFNKLFLKICLANSQGIVSVSQQTLNELEYYFPKLYAKKPNQVIYNYVDFSTTKVVVPQKIKGIKNNDFLLCVAQHRQNKNIHLLIKAFYLLIEREAKINSSTKLIVVGSQGPETENIRKIIQNLSLENRVVLTSSVSDGELCWLYKNCKVLVCPSSVEGFCLPLAEGLYFSAPTICSNIPILKEVGGSDCIYFDLKAEAIENLFVGIANLLKQPRERAKIGEFRFSKSRATTQYVEFYSTL